MNELKIIEASKFLSENTSYHSGAGSIVSSVKANQAIILAFNEGIDKCIEELETGENQSDLQKLKDLKILSL